MRKRTRRRRDAKRKSETARSVQSARIERLVEIVDFVQLETDPDTLFRAAKSLRQRIATPWSETIFTLDQEGLAKTVALQKELRTRLEELASGESSESGWELPAVKRRIVRYGREYV